MKEKHMEKEPRKTKTEEVSREYDFTRGVRGKYARQYAEGTNVVMFDPDVAKIFPNAKAVNSSLRAVAALIRTGKKWASE